MARDFFRNSFKDQSPPYRWARLAFLSSFLSFLEGQVPCKAIQIRLGKYSQQWHNHSWTRLKSLEALIMLKPEHHHL
jgi:hypothetical protein